MMAGSGGVERELFRFVVHQLDPTDQIASRLGKRLLGCHPGHSSLSSAMVSLMSTSKILNPVSWKTASWIAYTSVIPRP